MTKWYLSEFHCSICNEESVILHHGLAIEPELECDSCGYMMPVPPSVEVPESFAKAEHERLGIKWGGHE